MLVFLIVVAVLAVVFSLILSVSATFTVVYDNKWSTRIKVLWIDKEIELTKILSAILFPDKAAQDLKQKKQEKKKPEEKLDEAVTKTAEGEIAGKKSSENTETNKSSPEKPKEKKPNYFKNLWDNEGIVGILNLASNALQSAAGAVRTLIRGFHIYSLYVKIIVGKDDAAATAQSYGKICSRYYPVKGLVLSTMRVDNYDDLITSDFIAPRDEYGFQLIGSISVGALLKVLLSAGKIFLVNMIKNK